MALSAFGEAFLENLRDLTTPDRRSIVTLKDLAFENTSEASSVVRAIRQHVKQCPTAHRLPALYLVDCMLKTDCPEVYSQQLGQSLLEIFVFIWDHADTATRAALTKVCKLWRLVPNLDQKVVQACEAYLAPARQSASSAPVPAVGGVLPPPGYRAYPVTQPPRPTAPYGRPPVPLGNEGMVDPRMLGQQIGTQPQPTMLAFPALQPGMRPAYQSLPPPQAVLLPLPAYVQPQQPMLQHQMHVVPQQFAYARPAAPAQLPGAPIMSSAHIPPQLLNMRAATPPQQLVQQPMLPPVSPPLGSGSPQPAVQPAARPRSTEFPGSQALKELDATAVRDLTEASQRTRPGFLDAAFVRNKRRAALEQTGVSSRQWYPTVDLWLLGTTSAQASEQGAAEEEDATEAEDEKQYFVEEDPSQPECAISGEPFERFYDPDSDKWCYQDAVMLTGDDAAKYGVMEGSIVKVQCLAGAPSKLQMATLRAATTSAAAGDELRRAAAQPVLAASAAPATGVASSSTARTDSSGESTPPSAPHMAPAATTAHLAQPHPVVKEEQQTELHVGAVLDGVAGSAAASFKRPAGGMGTGPGPGGDLAAKRVKLEV